ncbi:MAG: MarR family transcriptional regulator [Chloroflexi bacterium]|nr:MarR family transcriptional regulator [Chloroflexota bacterium]
MNTKKKYRRYEVFNVLKAKPTASIKELCKATGIKWPSHVHALLQELENEGLIERKPYHLDEIKIVAEPAKPTPEPQKRRRRRSQPVNITWTVRSKQTPAQLEKAIERVVRMAQEKETGVDVLHDHRRPFPRHGLSARRIG